MEANKTSKYFVKCVHGFFKFGNSFFPLYLVTIRWLAQLILIGALPNWTNEKIEKSK